MAKDTAKPTAKAAKPAAKPMTKSEVFSTLAEKTSLTKKQVQSVLDSLIELVKTQLTNKKVTAPTFVIPGIVKLKVNHKPATKARKGINPQTGEEITIKAKPARKVVKASPLKAVKDMV